MTKSEFLNKLRSLLAGLDESEIDKSISFYSEAIDDRIEDGMSEEEATAAMGTPEEAAKNAKMEMPLGQIAKEKYNKAKKKFGDAWIVVIILAILASPIWVPMLGSVISAILSVYLVIWAVALALWVTAAAMVIGGLSMAVVAVIGFFSPTVASAGVLFGGALIAAALGLLLFIPVFYATKYLIKLTISFGKWLKSLFVGKVK